MRQVSVLWLSGLISSSAFWMIHHTECGNDEGKVQIESDKFLVGMFQPEGAKRCCYSNADLKSLNALCEPFLFWVDFSLLCAFTFLFSAIVNIGNQLLTFYISQPVVGVNLMPLQCNSRKSLILSTYDAKGEFLWSGLSVIQFSLTMSSVCEDWRYKILSEWHPRLSLFKETVAM